VSRQDPLPAETPTGQHGPRGQGRGPFARRGHQQVVQAVAPHQPPERSCPLRPDQLQRSPSIPILLPVAGQVVRNRGTAAS